MKSFLYILLSAAVLMACRKHKADAPDDFSVTTEKLQYKTGDTIQFNFSGQVGTIVFYSGEIGKRYEHRTRTSMAGSEKLVFQTSMQQGPIPPLPSPDSLQLLISTDLQGYDAANIQKATWANITSRNTKWPTSLTTGFTTSDSVDISDFNTAEKVNIAFRFLGKKTGLTEQRKWVIQSFTLGNNLPDGTITPLFASFGNVGWVQASLKNDSEPGTAANSYNGFNAWNVGTWNVSTADSVRNSNGIIIRTAYPITFNPGTNVNNEDNDDWLIATSIDLKTVKPDVGTVIQNETVLHLDNYKYVFKKAGTYQITFVAINATLDESKNVARQLTITILP